MASLRILFLTQVLPYPLDAGPKLRSYYTMRYLASLGHRITLLSFIREADKKEHLQHLRGFCEQVRTVALRRSRVRDIWFYLRSFTNGTPFLIRRDWDGAMAELVRTAVKESAPFHVIHADQLWMAPYALIGKTAAGLKTVAILDQHNAVFQIPGRMAEASKNPLLRLLLQLEARKLRDYERDLCESFERVVWVTEEDLALGNLSQEGLLRDAVIPIATDLTEKPLVGRKANAHRVTFIGGLHWPPNAQGITWFARRIWPEILQCVPHSVLTIIGKKPSRELLQLAGSQPGIETTGYVADLTSYLEETAVFIVPLLAGGGMRVKILDAWAWGLPVVSTRIGAEGLLTREEENILLADDPTSFSRAVVRVLGDRELAERLSFSGRRTVETHYDWRRAYSAWEHVYSCASSL